MVTTGFDLGAAAAAGVTPPPDGADAPVFASTLVEAADGGLPLWVEFDTTPGPKSQQQRIAEGRVIRRATEREAADFFGSTGGGGGATSSPAALQNAATTAARLEFDIQQAGQLSPAQIASIELNQDQLQQRIAEADQDAAAAAQNLTFLRDKLAAETRSDDRNAMLQTRSLMESITSRMERTQLERAGLVQQAQGLQAQLTQQANIANQAATAQAEQINEQRRQFNLEQQRRVATDIAEAAVSPGDVGRQAALLLAGTGGSPFSTALAQGEDFRTEQSLQGLDLLLGSRAELAHGPEQFDPTLISAPNVPIPQFGQVQGPDFAALLASMGLGGAPTALGAPRAPAAAPPLLQAPVSDAIIPFTGSSNFTPLGVEGAAAVTQRLEDQGFVRNERGQLVPGAAHGGTFTNRPGGSRGLPTSLGRREQPVIEGQSRAVNTEQVIVGEPAPDGTARPELVTLEPGSGMAVDPLTDDTGRPLAEAPVNATALQRTVPGVTLPAQASDRAREAVTAAGVTGELRQRPANRPLLPGPERLQPVLLGRQRPARAAHGGTFTNELLAGPGSTQVEPGIDFLDRAFRLAMSRLPFGRLPLPVELATPGQSPFVQQAAASVAALGRGVNPEEFLRETRRLTPRGISAAPQRRTA